MTALYIGLAGGLGSMSRFLLGSWLTRSFGDKMAMPIGALAVNVFGSLLMGLLVSIFIVRGEMDSRLRMVLTIGFLGGFTTYSTFALETVGLLEERNFGTACLYVGMTLLCAGLACFLGLAIGRRL